MAFIQQNLEYITAGNLSAPGYWVYKSSTETLATIVASAYFNSVISQFSVNDGIFISASDGARMVYVTSVTTNVTVATIPSSGLSGTNVANVADANIVGGIPVMHRINTAGGATANTDVVLTYKTLVTDIWVQNNGLGTASDTITVLSTAAAISNAIDISGADKTQARVSTIDNANATIAAGGTLRVTETDGGGSDSPATTVYVLGLRVA